MLAWAAWHLHLTLWVRSTLAARRPPKPRRYSWKVVMSEGLVPLDLPAAPIRHRPDLPR
jgi:hypothetical protein